MERRKEGYAADVWIYRAAAELFRICGTWLHDQKLFTKDDWQIYYAVDTDVVMMYLSPERSGRYGDVFRDGETTSLLNRLLGEFIFLSSPSPLTGHTSSDAARHLFLIPGHDAELYQVLSSATSQVSSAASATVADFRALTSLFEEYERCGDYRALLENIRDSLPHIVMLYDSSEGANSELERFSKLSDDLLINIERFHEKGFSFPVLESDESTSDGFRNKVAQWTSRLARGKQSKSEGVLAVMTDVEVLARLEQCNEVLSAKRKRIVLITGSPYLFEAAEKYFPDNQHPPRVSFADLYLRHPQMFLTCHDFFNNSTHPFDAEEKSANASAKFSVIEWLSVLFPRSLGRDRLLGQYDTHVSGGTSTGDKEGVNVSVDDRIRSITFFDIPKEWNEQVRTAAIRKYGSAFAEPKSGGLHEIAGVISGLRSRGHWSYDSYRTVLSEAAAKSLSKLYSSASWLGLWSDLGVVREPAKGIPALRFDGDYAPATRYCAMVTDLQRRSEKLSAENLSRLVQANRELAEMDPSLYHSHIVHALAFAVKGQWEACVALCRTAMSIADGLKKAEGASVHEVRRGREAAYLASIACRRRAARREDLGDANSFLEEARKRENDGAAEDVRFRSEELAIETRRIYFEYYCVSNRNDHRILVYARRVMAELSRVIEAPPDEDVRCWVLLQCYTNFFNLFVIATRIKSGLHHESVGKYLREFRTLIKTKEFPDQHAEVVLDVASIVAGVGGSRQELAREAIAAIAKLIPVLPYDKKRIELFNSLVAEYGIKR